MFVCEIHKDHLRTKDTTSEENVCEGIPVIVSHINLQKLLLHPWACAIVLQKVC